MEVKGPAHFMCSSGLLPLDDGSFISCFGWRGNPPNQYRTRHSYHVHFTDPQKTHFTITTVATRKPLPRNLPATCRLPDPNKECFLVYGGFTGTDFLDDVWQVTVKDIPSAPPYHATKSLSWQCLGCGPLSLGTFCASTKNSR